MFAHALNVVQTIARGCSLGLCRRASSSRLLATGGGLWRETGSERAPTAAHRLRHRAPLPSRCVAPNGGREPIEHTVHRSLEWARDVSSQKPSARRATDGPVLGRRCPGSRARVDTFLA